MNTWLATISSLLYVSLHFTTLVCLLSLAPQRIQIVFLVQLERERVQLNSSWINFKYWHLRPDFYSRNVAIVPSSCWKLYILSLACPTCLEIDIGAFINRRPKYKMTIFWIHKHNFFSAHRWRWVCNILLFSVQCSCIKKILLDSFFNFKYSFLITGNVDFLNILLLCFCQNLYI